MGVKGRLVPPRTLTSTETVEPSFRIFYRMTKDTKLGHYQSLDIFDVLRVKEVYSPVRKQK